MTPRGAKGVMIVIGPTEAELVLTSFLDLRRAIAALPMSALLLEHDMAGHKGPDKMNDAIEDFVGASETFLVGIEEARAGFPKLARLEIFSGISIGLRNEAAIAATLDDLEFRLVLLRNDQPAKA